MTYRYEHIDNTFTREGTLQVDGQEPVFWSNFPTGFYSYRTQDGANGKDSENPYSLSYFSRYIAWGSYHQAGCTYTGSVNAYPPYANASVDDLLGGASALSSADRLGVFDSVLSKAREADWNALVSAGESRETIQLINESLRTILRLLRRTRSRAIQDLRSSKVVKRTKGEPPSAFLKKAVKAFPSVFQHRWLQARYGYIPLMADVQSALDYFAERKAHGVVARFRSRKTRVEPRVRDGWPSVTTSRYQVILLVKEPPSEVSRLGLNDPFSLAWELLPLSFVYDWFLPVGDYLAAAHMQRSLRGSYVISEKNLSYLECQKHPAYDLTLETPLKITRLSFSRVISDVGANILPLGLRDPRDSSSAMRHLVDSVALIGQGLSTRLSAAERRRITSGL